MKLKYSAAAAVSALAALSQASVAWADDAGRDFCADRPGRNSPACVIDVGRFQVETSLVDHTYDKQGGVTTDTTDFADLELRWGVTPTAEVQLAWSPYVQVRTHGGGADDRISGSGDLRFAWRQSLRNPDGSGLSIAVEPFVVAPTGRTGIGAGKWQGGFIAPITYQVSQAVGVGFTPQVAVTPDQDGHGSHLAWTGVLSAGRQFGPVNLSADVWVNYDDDPAGHVTQATFDVSAAWSPNRLKDTQFDIGVNTGLNHQTPDVEAYLGLAKRF